MQRTIPNSLIIKFIQIGFYIRIYQEHGIIVEQQFSETAVKPFYNTYLTELKEWTAIEPAVTEKIRRKLFKKAM